MRKQYMKARHLYAVKAADRSTVPALLLDTALWDRIPAPGGTFTYQLSPKGSKWAAVLDPDTGKRRGMLVAMCRPGADDAAGQLAEFGLKSPGAEVRGDLYLDVISDARILMLWDKYASQQRLHSCPECGRPVAMNAASRLRAHTFQGAPCPRSNTPLTAEERAQVSPEQ
jgi:hypothetical protein